MSVAVTHYWEEVMANITNPVSSGGIFTAVAGRLYIATLMEDPVTTPSTAPPTLTGGGLTWTRFDTALPASGNRRLTCWWGGSLSPGSPAVLTLTTQSGINRNGQLCVDQFEGADLTNPIVQTYHADDQGTNATTGTVPINNAFGDATYNIAFAAFFNNQGVVITKDATVGWVALFSAAPGSNDAMLTSYKQGQDLSVANTWGTTGKWGGIACEIKAAAQPFTRVQSAQNAGTAITASVALATTPAVGDLLVAVIDVNSGTTTITMAGWTQIPTHSPITPPASATPKLAMFAKIAGASESTTPQITLGASFAYRMVVVQYHDAAGGAWVLDQHANNNASTGTALDSGTTAATAAATVQLAAFGIGLTATMSMPTNGFVGVRENLSTTPNLSVFERIIPGSAAANCDVTASATSRWDAIISAWYAQVTMINLTPGSLVHTRALTTGALVNPTVGPVSLTRTRFIGSATISPAVTPVSLVRVHVLTLGTRVSPSARPASLVHTRALNTGTRVSPQVKPLSLTHTRVLSTGTTISRIVTLTVSSPLVHTRAITPAPKLAVALKPASVVHTRALATTIKLSPTILLNSQIHTRALGSLVVAHALTPLSLTHSRQLNSPVRVFPTLKLTQITHARALGSPAVLRQNTLVPNSLVHSRTLATTITFALKIYPGSLVRVRILGTITVGRAIITQADLQRSYGAFKVGMFTKQAVHR